MTSRRIPSVAASVMPAILFLVLTWPVWRWLWAEWWRNDYYSYGSLIVPVAFYLAWRRTTPRTGQEATARRGDNRGLGLLVAALAAYLLLVTGRVYYLAAFAMIVMIAGLVWTFAGLLTLRQLAFPIGFMILMVPLPFVDRATLPLALITGACSGTLAHWLGLNVSVVGSAVTLPNANLVIGAQCSGINSVMALLALTALVAYAVKGTWISRLLLIAVAIPLAMLGNILRVASLLLVAQSWGTEAGFRFYHDYSGIATFLLALLLIIPLTRLLRCRTLRFEVL